MMPARAECELTQLQVLPALDGGDGGIIRRLALPHLRLR